MPSSIHQFYFDDNFGFGSESVFAWVDQEGGSITPPVSNVLLLTDGTPLLLTDGTNLLLAA